MPAQKNRHGLSRDIPSEIQRLVRQRCGFGCVICGLGIYIYDHFDPPFNEAQAHRADGITILCGGHDDKKTRGFISDHAVREANAHPVTLKAGVAHEFFEIGDERPRILLGGTHYQGMDTIIRIDGIPLLQLKPPESEGAPHRLSGLFCNADGAELFRIVDNEWLGSLESWDITAEGGTITIRTGPRDIMLRITNVPGREIRIERLRMYFRGYALIGDEKSLIIEGRGSRLDMSNVGTISAPPDGAGISLS
jgi:hypothetical protein